MSNNSCKTKFHFFTTHSKLAIYRHFESHGLSVRWCHGSLSHLGDISVSRGICNWVYGVGSPGELSDIMNFLCTPPSTNSHEQIIYTGKLFRWASGKTRVSLQRHTVQRMFPYIHNRTFLLSESL